jgi:putative PIN family toxin of toxin-antitoxin system
VLVVLDTNVLLSALRAERSQPAAIVDAWRTGRYSLVTSTEQIEEFKRAARYPKLRPYLPRRAVGRVVNELHTAEVLLERLHRTGDSPDPGDDYLLAMAIAGAADFPVTGDKALLSMKRIGSTRIVTPRRFITLTSLR